MKYICTLLLLPLLWACNANDDSITESDADPVEVVLTEALVETGIKYGPETRQFLDLYRPESTCPTPVYFDAHGNGGSTILPDAIIQDLNALGITVISWESLTSVNTQEEVETGWSDMELMIAWVFENAAEYNLDTSNLIVGGSSRGSILSWKFGHSGTSNIKGLYMYNALPEGVWGDLDWWNPADEVTTASPPIFFVYRREPGAADDPDDPDIHDPDNGFIIVQRYTDLGIGDKTQLVHSIGETANTDRYQFLADFAASLVPNCEN